MSVTTTGKFETVNASKYLQQLCKHFAHKVAATYDETSGEVALPVGPAKLTANDSTLTVTIDVVDADQLGRAHGIIDNHLERFAFREGFKAMAWQTVDG